MKHRNNRHIEKDGNEMSGMETTTGRRHRRRLIGAGVAVATVACATAAALVPAGAKAGNVTGGDTGMMCDWGNGGEAFTADRTFNVAATSGYTTEPDGNAIFDWSYTSNNSFQLPGPVLCANKGEHITVNLHNDLPVNTSIQFPGQDGVTYSYGGTPAPVGPVADATGNLLSLVQDLPAGGDMSYQFTTTHEGTFLYQSGTDPQLQVQMGLFGALVVYPNVLVTAQDILAHPYDGGSGAPTTNGTSGLMGGVSGAVVADAKCAYASIDDPAKCDPLGVYEKDRENIIMLSEVDPALHTFMEQAQVNNEVTKLNWNAYPVGYEAHYFMINGRSAPDTVAPNNAPWLPTQPYGAMASVAPWDPSANPLDAFIRYINVGNAPVDFHPHSNHENVIAADGALMKGQPVRDGQTGAVVTPGNDFTEQKFNLLIGTGSTLDATFRWTNEEGYADEDGSRVPVQWPQGPNMLEGDFWSGSPYLGSSGLLNPGITSKTQCGEYYHVAHDHNLTHVTNYGITFGGALTLIKVEPLEAAGDPNNPCNG